VKETEDRSWRRGAAFQEGSSLCGGLPCVPLLCVMQILTQHRTLGPQEGKTHRRPHPGSAGKFWEGAAVL